MEPLILIVYNIMPIITSRNSRSFNTKSKKNQKNGGSPPGISLNNLLQNIKCCVVHNLNNTILVSNYGLHRIEILDMNKQYIGSFGSFGVLENPRCINVDQENGNIIVTDRNNKVAVFDRHGNFIRRINQFRGLMFQFAPREIAVTSNGNILISDIENNRICCVDRMGIEKFEIKQYPISQGEIAHFDHPYGICAGIIDGQERIIVADSHNSQIVIFNMDGNYYNSFGQDGEGLENSDYIDEATLVNIAIDNNNNILCLDFEKNNKLIIIDGMSGYHRIVQLNTNLPISPRMIRIDQISGNIYLTDDRRNLIAVFDRNYQFLHFIPEVNIDFRILRKKSDIPAGIEDDSECGTCLEPLFERSAIDVNQSRNNINGFIVQLHQNSQAQAPHLFHYKCIKSWLESNGRPKTCPLCRTECLFHSQLTSINIPAQDDGVDFFEPSQVSAILQPNSQLLCNQYNGNQAECIQHKPKCLWKFINKQCIDNTEHSGGKVKYISKKNKNQRKLWKRSLKK
jgi:DNA-binding beta-propeller fold protein YncE